MQHLAGSKTAAHAASRRRKTAAHALPILFNFKNQNQNENDEPGSKNRASKKI
jgi:hypothetical protein